ncbi:MAG TPA: transglutaminase family protein, partial [Candidatus Acidoferrum sp.]|nr:transglutaminase family protein [Candidatus Acidoferrum sp.]
RYNPARIIMPGDIDPNDHFFADSRDIFLHGLLADRRMGTCSSMPILYIAVGRRLGYPLRLVTTKAHLFVRWESNTDRFDVEATGKGMNRYDDEHFKRWPFPVSDEEIHTERYLKSLTPPEELAVFLSLRGNCLREAGRAGEAADCYAAAVRLAPGWNPCSALLADVRHASIATKNQPTQTPISTAMIQQVDEPPQQSSSVPDPNPLLNIR